MLYVHIARQVPSAPAIMHVQTARYMPGCGAPDQTAIDSLTTLETLASQADAILFYLGDFPRRVVARDKAPRYLKKAWKIWGTRP